MARGGKREGAGRKVGALTKRTQQIAQKAVAEGITPLEVMLGNMRFFHQAAEVALERLLAGQATPADVIGEHDPQMPDPEKPAPNVIDAMKLILALRDKAGEAAKDAAPYVHSRLSPAEAGKGDKDAVPLPERLKAYASRDKVDPAGKVVSLKRSP